MTNWFSWLAKLLPALSSPDRVNVVRVADEAVDLAREVMTDVRGLQEDNRRLWDEVRGHRADVDSLERQVATMGDDLAAARLAEATCREEMDAVKTRLEALERRGDS